MNGPAASITWGAFTNKKSVFIRVRYVEKAEKPFSSYRIWKLF